MHPDLALLLSASGSTGSTGSPKLVRLSHRELASDAEAIASTTVRPPWRQVETGACCGR